MTQAGCPLSALFCRAALISEGCSLAGCELQCTVAGHRAFVSAANFTGKLALFCTSGRISEGCTLPGCVLQCTLPVNVGAATFQTDMAVPEACCQAVVCTAALISGRCVLPVSVLRCTVVRHFWFVGAANFHR